MRYCKYGYYDLRNLAEPRCPECGAPFDPLDSRTYLRRPPDLLTRKAPKDPDNVAGSNHRGLLDYVPPGATELISNCTERALTMRNRLRRRQAHSGAAQPCTDIELLVLAAEQMA
jgi:hypothetical protein